jgi:hypothetical protein
LSGPETTGNRVRIKRGEERRGGRRDKGEFRRENLGEKREEKLALLK